MKVKEYKVLEIAVEEGIRSGYNRAFKHTDTPTEEALKNAIFDNVMNSLCEWLSFEGYDDE